MRLNPGTFVTNVLGGLVSGVESFVTALPTVFPQKLIEWLTGGINFPEPPKSLAAAEMGPWLLKFFGLDWDGIQGMLVNVVGAGNVAALTQAYDLLTVAWDKVSIGADGKPVENVSVINFVNALLEQFPVHDANGTALPVDKMTPEKLVETAVQALVELVITEIAKKVPVIIIEKLTPAGGALSTIYNGVKWLVDNSEKLGNLIKQGT